MNEVREFNVIMQEEYWCVVVYYVLVILLGIKFYSKIFGIMGVVVGVLIIVDGRKVQKYWCFLIFGLQEISNSVSIQIFSQCESIVSGVFVSMYYMFGNMFMVKVS